MSEEHQHTYICEKCGNEADLTIKEDDVGLAEHKHEHETGKGTLVCKNCGNEADITFEEI